MASKNPVATYPIKVKWGRSHPLFIYDVLHQYGWKLQPISLFPILKMTNEKNYLVKAVKIFMVLFVVAIPIVWLALTQVNFGGDLTRIGKISDDLFAPQQYTFDTSKDINTNFDEAEILVIGDSFSINLQWQKEFNKHSDISIATITWEDALKGCVADKKSPFFFKGSTIIFQSVERNFKKNVSSQIPCLKPELAIPPKNLVYEHHAKTKKVFDLNGQFWVGISSIINTNLIKYFDSYYKIYNQYSSAKIIPIDDGCKFFSNSLCEYALIYKNDLDTEQFNVNLIDKMTKLNRQLEDKRVIWIIVPNKYSVYVESKNQRFFELVHKSGLGPDLFFDFINNKKIIPDLYQPNDTHLSGNGFSYLGKRIYSFTKN